MLDQGRATAEDLNYVGINTALGKRISIVGNGGKSTLARSLAEKTGLTYVELDALFWKPNWVESTAEELAEKVKAAIEGAPGGWIADGHYWSRIEGLVLQQTDMVVWLNLPWRIMFWRMLKRSFRRAWDKNKVCGDNTESWRLLFSTRSLWWYWLTHRETERLRGERLAGLLPRSIPVIRLRSAAELDRFYEVHELTRAT